MPATNTRFIGKGYNLHGRSGWPVLVIISCLLLGACTALPDTTQNLPAIEATAPGVSPLPTNPSLFAGRPAIPGPDALHQLSAAQIAHLKAFLDDPKKHRVPRHELLFDYLQDITENFTYYGQTLPASAALTLQSGNCMSLAVLTSALASAAGIEIAWQLMEDVPVFEYEGNLIVKGVHLRTILYQADWTPPVFKSMFIARPGLQVDYFPSQRERFIANIDQAQYLAMYFQNVAVEALEAEDLNAAYWNALEALNYAPDNSEAINTLAVTHRRAGDYQMAEQLYLHGIETGDDKLGLLKNYQALLEFTGRTAEAQKISARLESMDDPSPWHWLHLAQSAEQQQEYAAARRYYRKAIEQAPNLHEAWLGIALANIRDGELLPARQSMQQAIAKADKPATKRLYEAKLELLSKLELKQVQ